MVVTFEIVKNHYRDDIQAKLGIQDLADLRLVSTDKAGRSLWPGRAAFHSPLPSHSTVAPTRGRPFVNVCSVTRGGSPEAVSVASPAQQGEYWMCNPDVSQEREQVNAEEVMGDGNTGRLAEVFWCLFTFWTARMLFRETRWSRFSGDVNRSQARRNRAD